MKSRDGEASYPKSYLSLCKGEHKTVSIPCPECGLKYSVYDIEEEAVICPKCGLVLMYAPPDRHGVPALGWLFRPLQKPAGFDNVIANNSLNKSGRRYKYLIRQYERRFKESGPIYRKQQYHGFVGVVSTWLRLSDVEKQEAHDILKNLPDLRSATVGRRDYRTVICSICTSVKMKSKSFVNFDNDLFEELDFTRAVHLETEKRIKNSMREVEPRLIEETPQDLF